MQTVHHHLESILFNKRKLKVFEHYDLQQKQEIQKWLEHTFSLIDKLPKPIMKTVILMYYVEGLSIRSIAHQLHLSPIWISKVKANSLEFLNQYL